MRLLYDRWFTSKEHIRSVEDDVRRSILVCIEVTPLDDGPAGLFRGGGLGQDLDASLPLRRGSCIIDLLLLWARLWFGGFICIPIEIVGMIEGMIQC